MTFVIVASPCTVVLATMPPLLAAIANAGRHGVLVKSAVAMERLGVITAVTLDKTGTLTDGVPHVTDVRVLPGVELDEAGLVRLAAAMEQFSEHPLARAVVDAATGPRGRPFPTVDGFTSRPGQGVHALVADRTVAVGNPAWLLRRRTVPRTASVDRADPADRSDRAGFADAAGRVVCHAALVDRADPADRADRAGFADAAGRAVRHAALVERADPADRSDRAGFADAAGRVVCHAALVERADPADRSDRAGFAYASGGGDLAAPPDPAARAGVEVAAGGVVAELEGGGRTVVVVAVDGAPVGVLGLADRLRPGAAARSPGSVR